MISRIINRSILNLKLNRFNSSISNTHAFTQYITKRYSTTTTTTNTDGINNNNQDKNNNGFSSLKHEEIEFFNNLSKDWWNSEGTMKPLHRMNPLRVQYIIKRLQSSNNQLLNNPPHQPLKGLNVIDVGCGAGLLTESLSRLGANKVVGLDAAKNNISMAIAHASKDLNLQKNLQENKLEYVESTIENYVNTNQSFDVVCSLEVVEHVENPKEFVNLLTKIVKSGGSLFVSTMNKTALSYLTAILGAEYILKLVPIGTHHWNQFISPDQLKQYLTDCTVQDTSGLFYNPITSNWSFINDKSVNYIIHAIKK
eukprot:gene9103-11155_t